ncbi:MAG: VPLPA-CTERM sorting domain-containing protein [Paracoccaceae bacterium]
MNKHLKATLAALGVFALVAITSTAAVAATCSTGASGKLTQNPGSVALACDAGSTNNDFLNPLQVNTDSIHGFDDWVFAGKDNFEGSDEPAVANIGFTTSGGLQSGTWDIADNTFGLFTNVMIVIKGGVGNNTQPNYVAYLLSSLLGTDGGYLTPFFNLNNGNAKDISHLSAYVRGPISAVPLPAALPLLLTGLAGLGFMARRRAA